jgi:PleD family two-component response regulator
LWEGEDVAEVPHILVVEDQIDTAEMLTSYFEAQGYEVTAVGWGEDALAFIENNTPDLVMLDIHLPDIDGYEVCRHLRSRRRMEHVPVIFLTERRQRGDKLTGLELGAADYITKPFDVQELRLRVRNVLRRSRLGPLSHPITGLPAASLVDERLHELLSNSDWAALSVGLHGLDKFAETYGFVARDDVVRAVALMLNHIVNESHDPDAFVGHMDDTDFCVVVTLDNADRVQHALEVRLNEAMAFFYPRADWEAKQANPDAGLPNLDVTMGVLRSSVCSFDNLADLKRAIIKASIHKLGS